MKLTEQQTAQLIQDIATRAGTTDELCEWWDCSKDELRAFVAENRMALEIARQASDENPEESAFLTPTQLDDLWITKKFERLRRMETIANKLYDAMIGGSYGDAALLREFRSYLTLAANELGQLLHRGAGESSDGDTVTYRFEGIDLDSLK